MSLSLSIYIYIYTYIYIYIYIYVYMLKPCILNHTIPELPLLFLREGRERPQVRDLPAGVPRQGPHVGLRPVPPRRRGLPLAGGRAAAPLRAPGHLAQEGRAPARGAALRLGLRRRAREPQPGGYYMNHII